MKFLRILLTALLLSAGAAASAVPLLGNGTFEATSDYWLATSIPESDGQWWITTGNVAPRSGLPTAGPRNGEWYALSDQALRGTHVLWQPFFVEAGVTSAVLNFSMFVNSEAPFNGDDGALDGGPAQFGRVDLLAIPSGNPFDDPFNTTDRVLRNFYFGIDAGPDPNPYTDYTFDITSLIASGGLFMLRFATSASDSTLNMGVDDVSIEAQFAVPEPGSIALVALGLAGLAMTRRRI